MFHYNVILHALVFFWELLTVFTNYIFYICVGITVITMFSYGLLQFLEVYDFNKLCKCV